MSEVPLYGDHAPPDIRGNVTNFPHEYKKRMQFRSKSGPCSLRRGSISNKRTFLSRTGGATFDVGWIKKAADVVLSDEWAKTEVGTDMNACSECGGTGRIQVERDFFIDNLLVRIHFIIVVIRWTGLAPWEFEFPFPGSLTSTFLVS